MVIKDSEFEIIHTSGRIFKAGVRDILGAPVDSIVNPANSGLSHGGGLAAVISDEAGPELDNQCEKIIKKIGKVPETNAVPTKAGRLPYKGIIHAVGPRMGSGNEKDKIQKTVINSLLIADKLGWGSIAFPAISTGIFGVPGKICAEAFKESVPIFWKKKKDTSVNLVWLCLTIDDYPVFKKVINP